MKRPDQAYSPSDIQLDQLIRELKTPDGRARIAEAAYREAKRAEEQRRVRPELTT